MDLISSQIVRDKFVLGIASAPVGNTPWKHTSGAIISGSYLPTNIFGYTPEQPLTFVGPLVRSVNSISLPLATGSVSGYLSSTDWTTFNNKQSALGYTPINKAGDTGIGSLTLTGTAVLTIPQNGSITSSAGGLMLSGASGTDYVYLSPNLSVGALNNQLNLGSAAALGFTSGAAWNTVDAKFVRESTGLVQYRGNNGLAIKNLAGSSDANLNAGDVIAASQVAFGYGLMFGTSTGSRMRQSSDGVLRLTNNAQDDFGRLQFGGTTSAFPAIKRNGNQINFRLADDSADADFKAKLPTFTGSTITYSTNSHTIVDNGANGFYMTASGTIAMSVGVAGNGSFISGSYLQFGTTMVPVGFLRPTTDNFRFNNAADNARASVEVGTIIQGSQDSRLVSSTGQRTNAVGDGAGVWQTTYSEKYSVSGAQIGWFNVTPVLRQTGGALTAGASYTSNEQTMIQSMWTALRNYGLLT